MKTLPIVALIGQTNAGKSSLLNRFARQKIAIVAREEGTTRDNVAAKIDGRYLMIDTAGLKTAEDDFEAQIQDQIEDAVAAADLILVVLDSSRYPSDRDKVIAKKALKSQKPVFLLLNKCDLAASLPEEEFLCLGIRDRFRLSATTGEGVNAVKQEIQKVFSKNISRFAEQKMYIPDDAGTASSGMTSKTDKPLAEKMSQQSPLRIALIGRPNVGKSSLFNSLAQKQQALVSSKQGTTRDVNRLEIRFKGRDLEILDTAGLRRPGKREVGIEKFSAIRSLAAIEESDVVALLVDATEPHSKLDQSLAGQIVEAGKGIVVVLTKADQKSAEEIDGILNDLERDFNFLPFAPVLITSSATGKNVTKLMDLALEIDATRHQELKTADLNKILNEAIVSHPPAGLKNTKPKPKYIVQTDTCPPWFVVHGHDLGLLHWSWKRYLERKIRESYPFIGTPIKISYKNS